MGLITNADANTDEKQRARFLAMVEDQQQGFQQDAEARGKAAVRRGQWGSGGVLPLAAQVPITVPDEDGELVEYDDIALEVQIEEPDYDESVSVLPIIRMVECRWWPFKAKGAEVGYRPRMGPKAWDAVYDGVYCLRCRSRHAAPHPDRCANCLLTKEHRQRALDYMERVAEAMHTAGPNRETRRRLQRGARRTQSGLVLPGGAFGGHP